MGEALCCAADYRRGGNSSSGPSLSPSGYAFRSGSFSISEATNLFAWSCLRFHFVNGLVVINWVTCFSLLAAAATSATSPAAPQPAQTEDEPSPATD